jgi:hypothetical protein
VLVDVEDELVSIDRAKSEYGAVVRRIDDGTGYQLDVEATKHLRQQRSGESVPNRVNNGAVTVDDAAIKARSMDIPVVTESRTDRIIAAAKAALDERICKEECPKQADGRRCPFYSAEARQFWGGYTLAMWSKENCPQAERILPLFQYKRIY